MATAKTSTLTFRIEPQLKEALRTAAGGRGRQNQPAVFYQRQEDREDLVLRPGPVEGRQENTHDSGAFRI